MLVLIRLVILVISGWVYNVTRKCVRRSVWLKRQSIWLIKIIPWLKVISVLTALAMLISLILEIIIKFKTIKS